VWKTDCCQQQDTSCPGPWWRRTSKDGDGRSNDVGEEHAAGAAREPANPVSDRVVGERLLAVEEADKDVLARHVREDLEEAAEVVSDRSPTAMSGTGAENARRR